ncbi:MAG: hypothetical protein PHV82_11770 [Victivallaceae bacterium]|nr:hypothetical protein [Victivallaceae bacterium]
MTTIIAAQAADNAVLLGMGIGAAVGTLLTLLAVWIVLAGVFMFIGAGVAKVAGRSFGKAVAAALLAGLSGNLVGGIFLIIPVIGPVIGVFANIIMQIFIIKTVFETETGKAVLTWVFSLVAQIIVAVIAMIIFGGALIGMFAAAHH